MLIGLAAKNAILIVEFAKDQYEQGKPLADAALEGARLRLRPILMTSFAFILGCVPLWTATGAGSVARQIMGTTVIGGCWPPARSGSSSSPEFSIWWKNCLAPVRSRLPRRCRKRLPRNRVIEMHGAATRLDETQTELPIMKLARSLIGVVGFRLARRLHGRSQLPSTGRSDSNRLS